MSIRVLDPDGRVLRPVSPGCARNWVEHHRADWLHASGIEPDRKHGTIIMRDHPKESPADRAQTQVYDADGQFVGYIYPEAANRAVMRGWCIQVCTCFPDGRPRAVIVPKPLPPAAKKMIRCIEAGRAAEAVTRRAVLRDKITAIINDAQNWESIEKEVDVLFQQYLGAYGKEISLAEFRTLRRRVAKLELALAPDLKEAREKLFEKCIL